MPKLKFSISIPLSIPNEWDVLTALKYLSLRWAMLITSNICWIPLHVPDSKYDIRISFNDNKQSLK